MDRPMPADPTEQRLLRLEAETILLRGVVAHLAAFSGPQARVAIVRNLTGSASAIGRETARSTEHDEIIAKKARELLTMIASGAAGAG